MLGHMETVFSRAKARCDLLGIAPYSDRPDMLFRPYLGAGHRATLETLTTWMREAGMTVSVDAAANIVGRYGATSREAPVLLFGSHVDSVENGGRYDGMLGVLLGIEVVEHFHRQGRRFPFALEVIGFGDEEGSRFPAYMLGSRAVAGMLGEVDGDVRDVQESRCVRRLPSGGCRLNICRRPGACMSPPISKHISSRPRIWNAPDDR